MTVPDTPTVEAVRHGDVVEIAFNRPERRNALDLPSRALFAARVRDAIEDESVRAIVLTGRGGHFCAGGDIGSMNPDEGLSAEAGRARMRRALRHVEALYTCDKPVVAAVEGCAFGGGFGLALLADVIVASESARFCMSFARIGLVPDSGSLYTLPRIVGVQRAKALLLSGRELGAHEAREWGLALEVTAAGRALERALELAAALATASPVATALTKTALANTLSSDLRGMLEYEATAQGLAFSSDWHRDAARRFLQREPSRFRWPEPRRPQT